MENKLNYHMTRETGEADVETSNYLKLTVDRGIDSSRTVQFTIDSQDDSFVDLSECYIKTVFRVVTTSGEEISETAQVFPSFNWGNFLWSQVNLSLNGTSLPPNNEYAYTAILIDLLGSTHAHRENVTAVLSGTKGTYFGSSHLKHALVWEDALAYSKKLVSKSRPCTVIDRIHSDFIMSCSQLLPSKIRLGITLFRSKDSVLLLKSDEDPETYKIEVDSVSLYVKRVHFNQAARLKLERSLQNEARLTYQRLHSISFSCAEGVRSWGWHNCFNGIAPRRVFMILLSQEAYFGSWTRNSDYFESAGVTSVRFALDGRDIMTEPYRCSFNYDADGKVDTMTSRAVEPFAGLCKVLGTFTNPSLSQGMPYMEYMDGRTVFAVELEHADSMDAVNGSLDVQVEFAK